MNQSSWTRYGMPYYVTPFHSRNKQNHKPPKGYSYDVISWVTMFVTLGCGYLGKVWCEQYGMLVCGKSPSAWVPIKRWYRRFSGTWLLTFGLETVFWRVPVGTKGWIPCEGDHCIWSWLSLILLHSGNQPYSAHTMSLWACVLRIPTSW